VQFLNEKLCVIIDQDFANYLDAKISYIKNKLNRPIRVCGVKNEGEPGGGAIWIQDEKIYFVTNVESSQVNMDNEEQTIMLKCLSLSIQLIWFVEFEI
jgi:hypothetical protein